MTGTGDRFSDMELSVPLEAAVERLVRGGSAGDDLAPLAEFLDDVAAATAGPPPPRTPELEAALRSVGAPREPATVAAGLPGAGPSPRSQHAGPAHVRGRVAARRAASRSQRRSWPAHGDDPGRRVVGRRVAVLGLAAKAVAGLALAGTAAAGAAAAGVLPAPVADAVRRAVEFVTPFELPDEVSPGGEVDSHSHAVVDAPAGGGHAGGDGPAGGGTASGPAGSGADLATTGADPATTGADALTPADGGLLGGDWPEAGAPLAAENDVATPTWPVPAPATDDAGDDRAAPDGSADRPGGGAAGAPSAPGRAAKDDVTAGPPPEPPAGSTSASPGAESTLAGSGEAPAARPDRSGHAAGPRPGVVQPGPAGEGRQGAGSPSPVRGRGPGGGPTTGDPPRPDPPVGGHEVPGRPAARDGRQSGPPSGAGGAGQGARASAGAAGPERAPGGEAAEPARSVPPTATGGGGPHVPDLP